MACFLTVTVPDKKRKRQAVHQLRAKKAAKLANLFAANPLKINKFDDYMFLASKISNLEFSLNYICLCSITTLYSIACYVKTTLLVI